MDLPDLQYLVTGQCFTVVMVLLELASPPCPGSQKPCCAA